MDAQPKGTVWNGMLACSWQTREVEPLGRLRLERKNHLGDPHCELLQIIAVGCNLWASRLTAHGLVARLG